MNGRIRFHGWTDPEDFGGGAHEGTAVRGGVLVLDRATTTRQYVDPHQDRPPATYDEATWTSPEVVPGFAVTEVIPSWNAVTPSGTWLEVSVAGTTGDGVETPWYVLGRWAETDQDISPASLSCQKDEHARVAVDVLTPEDGHPFASYRLRVSLLRRTGSTATPSVSLLGVMGSAVELGLTPPSSAPGGAAGTVIDVPAYSQFVHRGRYLEWGGGGEAWCSPTSATMLLEHWGRGPTPDEYAWVDPRLPDRVVPHAARHTFDHDYRGAGNWSFSTAYAGRYGVRAYVTRLRSLTEMEQFVAAGIPLAASVSFTRDELHGAGYTTAGHLLTVVGFDADGNVVCNDPAAHQLPDNAEVRTTFDRTQFACAWLRPTGGIVYVIVPPEVDLPPRPAQANW